MKTIINSLLILLLLIPQVLQNSAAGPIALDVTMVLWRGETEAERGFRDGLKARGYQVNYHLLNANQQRKDLANLLRSDLDNLRKSDYIYSFGTTATKMVKQIISNHTPHLFNIVLDPVGSGIVDSLQHSGGNLSGVSHQLPLQSQLQAALKMGAIKRLGFFFNPRERNSELTRIKLIEVAKQFDIAVIELRCPPESNRLDHYLQQLSSHAIAVDAVYLPMDSYLISQAAKIGQALQQTRLISIGAQRTYIDNGVLIGFVPDYYDLGRVAASLLDRHYKGESLQQMGIYEAKTSRLLINERTLDHLKSSLPAVDFANAVIVP
ncbi:MAG: ABC transporter substrate-binding protein [Motiliproteus sp.]